MKIYSLPIFILLLNLSNVGFSQDSLEYEFDGKVSLSRQFRNEVEVRIYDEDKKIKEFTTPRSGKFVFLGIAEKHYTLEFIQEGYETKRIVINTDNTNNIKNGIGAYRFKVTLEEKVSAEKPEDSYTLAGVIEINAAKTKFTHNKSINRSRKHRESYNYLSNND